MNIIEIKGIKESYPEQIEGTDEWYYCKEGKNTCCDLYEAEEMIKYGDKFTGMNCHLIHFPEGTVHSPFEMKENFYVDKPVYDKGKIYFLSVDFTKKLIQINRYFPEDKKLQLIKELPLNVVEDCYNLMLKTSPIMLTRDTNNGIYEIIYPENKKIKIGETESLLFRDKDDLYFSEWYEDPDYHENVIVRDFYTGEIKDKFRGYLCKLPNGVYWKI